MAHSKEKADKKDEKKSTRREEKKNDLHTTIVNLEIPRGVRVSDYTFNNTIKYFHT
jgi:hypothetical protein